MSSIGAFLNSFGMDGLGDGVGKKTTSELSQAVGDSLVIIERQHQKKELGSGKGRAVKGKWTSRTGRLSKSFHRDWRKGNLYGAYGSNEPYSEKVEKGGMIKARKKFLAIPTENAPKDVWPRHIRDLFFIRSKKGNPLLVQSAGKGELRVMFILKRSVKLPPRPALDRAVKATQKAVDDRIFKAIDKGTGGGGLAK